MTRRIQDVLEQALQLSPEERAELVSHLTASLEEGESTDPEEWQRLWDAELDRRLQSLEDGTAELVPWEQVRERLHAIVAGARKSD